MPTSSVPFSATAPLHDITFFTNLNRLHDHFGHLAQTQSRGQINFDFRNFVTLHLYSNSEGVRTYGGEFLPFNVNGAYLGYKTATPTPTSIEYADGPYYPWPPPFLVVHHNSAAAP